MKEESLALFGGKPPFVNTTQWIAALVGGIGLLLMLLAWFGVSLPNEKMMFYASLLMLTAGISWYGYETYKNSPEGIKNNGIWFSSLTNWGWLGWVAGILITGFYVVLYWYPQYMGLGADGNANTGIVGFFDPLSMALKGKAASQWFVYGTLYTLAILAFGIKFIYKYRHNRYHLIRTISVMIAQLFLAFLIPEIMEGLHADQPYFSKDLKYVWPLNYYFFEDWHLDGMANGGSLGMFYLVWGIALIVVVTPVLTYYFGKRWYCSWVCGCGGLAETAGDPFRHLSDKSLEAWQIERIIIHGVLLLIVVTTGIVLYTYFTGNNLSFAMNFWLIAVIMVSIGGYLLYNQWKNHGHLQRRKTWIVTGVVLAFVLGYLFWHNGQSIWFDSYKLRQWYAFFIGSTFSGVIGVGFYPLLGNRVWCRFGCPMAAILGIQQKYFSRFRITTNGNQCISCGNCSTFCEMGIDVRSYAQKGQNIVRASCVGCGICAAVCPRGVLRLENGSVDLNQKTDWIRNIHVKEEDIGILK